MPYDVDSLKSRLKACSLCNLATVIKNATFKAELGLIVTTANTFNVCKLPKTN